MTGYGFSFLAAFADQRHNLLSSLCFALAVAAALTPILLIWGLKQGVIDGMTQRILEDPRALEIYPIASGAFDGAFFDEIANAPETLFVVPATRDIAARINLLRNPQTGATLRSVSILPTAPDDPLLPGIILSGTSEIALSAQAATVLQATVGDQIEAVVQRRLDDVVDRGEAVLEVAAIVPTTLHGLSTVFASVPALEAIETFRDGFAAPYYGWSGPAQPRHRDTHASFRLYARTLDSVLPLKQKVERLGARTRARTTDIATLTRLRSDLGRLFAVIASCAIFGMTLALGATLRGNLQRLTPTLAAFRLMGAGPLVLMLIPIIQSFAIALVGGVLAGGAALATSTAINLWLAGPALPFVALPSLAQIGIGIAIFVIATAFATAWAVKTALSIEPDHALRKI